MRAAFFSPVHWPVVGLEPFSLLVGDDLGVFLDFLVGVVGLRSGDGQGEDEVDRLTCLVSHPL